jgi:hypothetical protein
MISCAIGTRREDEPMPTLTDIQSDRLYELQTTYQSRNAMERAKSYVEDIKFLLDMIALLQKQPEAIDSAKAKLANDVYQVLCAHGHHFQPIG